MALDPNRYAAEVTNIRDVTKWMMAALGGIFVVLLTGVQFRDIPFLTDPWVALAGIVAASGLMTALSFALRILVGEGLSFDDLACKWAYWPERRFLNRLLAPATFSQFRADLDALDARFRRKEIKAEHPQRLQDNAYADELLAIAKWHVVRRRFRALSLLLVLLIPIELVAAGVLAGAVTSQEPARTEIIVKLR